MKLKLADALLRRKELQQKVDQIRTIKDANVYKDVMTRRPASEGYDDIIGKLPKLDLNQVTREYDYYANKLRIIDGAIQQLNWTTDISVDPKVWMDFAEATVGK